MLSAAVRNQDSVPLVPAGYTDHAARAAEQGDPMVNQEHETVNSSIEPTETGLDLTTSVAEQLFGPSAGTERRVRDEPSSVDTVLDYLALENQGVIEAFHEAEGRDRVVGYFTGKESLRSAMRDQGRGRLFVGLQPRPTELFGLAPNEFRAGLQLAKPEEIDTVVASVMALQSADIHANVDEMLRMITGAPPLVAYGPGIQQAVLVVAIPPIPVGDSNREDLLERLEDVTRSIRATLPDGLHLAVAADLGLHVEISALDWIPQLRSENPRFWQYLSTHWTISGEVPAPVLKLISGPRASRTAKLFSGLGRLPLGPNGLPLEPSQENYDRAVLAELILKSSDTLSREQLAAALWNRPGGAARRLGKRYLARMLDTVADEKVDLDSVVASNSAIRASTSSPSSSPRPLHEQLWGLYFEQGDRTVSTRLGVGVADKAAVVVAHLLGRGADFYEFVENNVTSFVLDGTEHTIDSRDPQYRNWFHREVRLFGTTEPLGTALTKALEVAVRTHPMCRRAARSAWGHFDRVNGRIYLCFDPNQAVVHRIGRAVDGRPIVEAVANGTDGVVLRCARRRARAFEYIPGSDLSVFERLVHAHQALSEIDRLGSTVFNLACLIPGHGQRPLKHHLGPEGSGKTTAAGDAEYVYYGRAAYGGFDQPQELWSAIASGGPLVTQDNVETDELKKFRKEYRLMATGGSKEWRKLYTNAEVVRYFSNGSLVRTSVEGETCPEDLDRAFEFHFDSLYKEQSVSSRRAADLESNSDLMLSSVLEILSTKFLPDFEDKLAAAHSFLVAHRPRHPKLRFAEFAAIMKLWVDAVGPALWSVSRGKRRFDGHDLFLAIMDQQSRHQELARAEADPVLQVLDRLRDLALRIAPQNSEVATDVYGVPVRLDGGRVSIGPATTTQLFVAASKVAKELGQYGAARAFDNARQLGQRIAAADKSGTLRLGGWTRRRAGTVHDSLDTYVFHSREPSAAAGEGDSGTIEDVQDVSIGIAEED